MWLMFDVESLVESFLDRVADNLCTESEQGSGLALILSNMEVTTPIYNHRS